MNPRNTVLLLLLVLGVGGFYYFYDVKGGQEREAAKETQERLFPALEADEVQRLRLAAEGGGRPPLELTRAGARWLIAGEPPSLAAQDRVGPLVEQVVGLKRASVIEEEPSAERLAEFGLDRPAFTLTLGLGGATPAPPALALGAKTPDDGAYYARVGGAGPILEVPAEFMTPLSEPVEELREPSALPVEPGEVSRVRLVTAAGLEIDMARPPVEAPAEGEPPSLEPAAWTISKPEAVAGDGRKIQDFLWRWRNLKAGRFLARGEAADFSAPRLRLEVWEGDAKEPRVVELGGPVAVKPGMAYLRRLDPEEAMVVDLGSVGNMAAEVAALSVGAFEDRHLARFQEDEVDRLEGTVGGRPFKVRRIRDGWEVEEPARTQGDAADRSSALNDLLYALKDLEWTARGGAAFQTPRAAITLRRKGGAALAEIRVGPVGPGGQVSLQLGEGGPLFTTQDDPCPRWEELLRRLEPAPSPSPSPAPSPSPQG